MIWTWIDPPISSIPPSETSPSHDRRPCLPNTSVWLPQIFLLQIQSLHIIRLWFAQPLQKILLYQQILNSLLPQSKISSSIFHTFLFHLFYFVCSYLPKYLFVCSYHLCYYFMSLFFGITLLYLLILYIFFSCLFLCSYLSYYLSLTLSLGITYYFFSFYTSFLFFHSIKAFTSWNKLWNLFPLKLSRSMQHN